jgi:cyclopropane fatty-acyl-phospholipid synthase-like methyltransferase
VSEPEEVVDLYGASYGGFASDTYAEVRRDTYGEELGQSSWLTREELDRFATELALGPSSRLLEIGSGSGGPALHLVRSTGCEVVGIDVNEDGVANATRLAREAELDARASFVRADASQPLPFESESFAALLSVDAINHLPDRPRLFADWARVIQAGGRVLFTDPVTVTGPLGSDEVAIRASIGYFLFVPHGEDERLLQEAGLRVLEVEDATENMATVADRWRAARAKRADALREIEGDETFDGQQRFLEVAATLARERRLSRFVYLAEKPT